MLSKSQIKLIKALSVKKYRNKHRLFIVEGLKTINEFINSEYKLHQLYLVDEAGFHAIENKEIITKAEMKKISSLKNPSSALAIFEIIDEGVIDNKGLKLALDDIRDPGNLGTIIRLCDWFGVSSVLCSKETVDCYNPKVVQATMGSLSRIQVYYIDLEAYLNTTDKVVYGAYMDGENVYTSSIIQEGIIVLGNEANGISDAIEKYINHKISIPRFGDIQETESLNVATATSILLSEFKRRTITEK
ncbi:MAG: RNA methyltransferase [Flavobacteriaceae bacterium]|nr:RNA methyltransferase [Flavobacteriaceae bacterium]